VFAFQELTVELMAAKQELEAYVNKEHPHPQYLRHHISTCCDTVEKQAAVAEGFWLVADGFPQDTTVKINGHADADTHPSFTSGSVFCFEFVLIIAHYFYSDFRGVHVSQNDSVSCFE